jgi:hypothetical protein
MLPNADATYGEIRQLEIFSEMAIKTKEIDWKPAIILSAAYLEKFGISKISEFLKNRRIKLCKKLDKFSLNEISVFLYILHQINDKEFTQINQIQKARNRIINPRGTKIPVYFGEKADNKYEKMVENAINLISSLKSDY